MNIGRLITKEKPRSVSAVLLGAALIAACLASCSSDVPESYEFYNHPPEGWIPIGEGTQKDYQQSFVYGDFDGDEVNEMVGSFSHSAVGMFIHENTGGSWEKSILHPRFDPDLTHTKGMDGGWPVKGIVSGDFDADGFEEVISMADAVSYPPVHQNQTVPFPGCIYIDWNETADFTANPLIWGQWGENVSDNQAAIMIPTPISSAFRGSNTTGNGFSDFLVKTLRRNGDVSDGHLYILEQPESTFNSVDYRYVGEDLIDEDPMYPNEAFYFKRLFIDTPSGDLEMVFSPSEWGCGAVSADPNGNVFDYDADGLMDLVVLIQYMDSDNQVLAGSVRVYHRLLSSSEHGYRFEEAFRQDVQGVGFGNPKQADLNGDPTDGKEGWVFQAWADFQLRAFGVSGVATLQKNGDDWVLLGTHATNRAAAKSRYDGTYSHPAIIDADGDGYDDVVIICTKDPVVSPSDPDHYYFQGDLVLFRNLAGEPRGFPELFSLDEDHSESIWEDDSFSWHLKSGDFNDDGELEVGTALCRREPFWGSEEGLYQVYYASINW